MLRTPHWRSNRRSPVETPGRLTRNRGRTLRREENVPRIFKRISVSYGPPVDYAEFLAMPRTRETARGCDRPRDGSNSGPARRVPAAAQRRREWDFALIVLVHRDGRRAPSRAWSFPRNALWSNWECSRLPGAAALQTTPHIAWELGFFSESEAGGKTGGRLSGKRGIPSDWQ